jgi:hypothetical protein
MYVSIDKRIHALVHRGGGRTEERAMSILMVNGHAFLKGPFPGFDVTLSQCHILWVSPTVS